jgi:hypothetical protein
MKNKLTIFVLSVLVMLMTVISTASATSTQVQSFDIEMLSPTLSCDSVNILIRAYIENVPASFYMGIVVRDGNGVHINGLWTELTGPSTLMSVTFISNILSHINNITARPITIEVYDLNNTYNGSNLPPANSMPNNMAVYNAVIAEQLMSSIVYDPGIDNADCANLPIILPTVFGDDGRINKDQAAPFVVYPVAGGLQVYTPQGNLLFTTTADEISAVACPTIGNILIKKVGNINLFRTTGCGFLMTSPSLNGEKTYYLLFASLTSTGYTSFEE